MVKLLAVLPVMTSNLVLYITIIFLIKLNNNVLDFVIVIIATFILIVKRFYI